MLPKNHVYKPNSSFIENLGQENSSVFFTVNQASQHFYFLSNSIRLSEFEKFSDNSRTSLQEIAAVCIELTFLNSRNNLLPYGINKDSLSLNYFIGNDPSKWKQSVSIYNELKYPDVWEGIDLRIQNLETGLKLEWEAATPNDISNINLTWNGADKIEIDDRGNLLVHHALGVLTDPKPLAWQLMDGEKIFIDCEWTIDDSNIISFMLTGNYNENIPLIIDPILPYTTYIGGTSYDECWDIAVDQYGCAYVTGQASSTDFPVTPGAYMTTFQGTQANTFISKFSPDGDNLIFSTFFGSATGSTLGLSIYVNEADETYVCGYTNATDLPTTPGAYENNYGGGFNDVFISKFSADGSDLLYSTYFGINGASYPEQITLDSLGNIYIGGYTNSSSLPTTPGVFQPAFSGSTNCGFIGKFSPDLSSLLLCTYIGGSGSDGLNKIHVDSQNYIYVSGWSYSQDYPTTPGAYQQNTTNPAGNSNAVVTKFTPDASALEFSTYFGGSNSGISYGLAVDESGVVCIGGNTTSTDLPLTPGAYQTSPLASQTCYFAKISSDGSTLLHSTYFGGTEISLTYDIEMDQYGNVYGTGRASYPGFPITPFNPPIASGISGGFVSCLNSTLTGLFYSTIIGSAPAPGGFANGNGIALDQNNTAYVAGDAAENMPTTPNAYQPNAAGSYNGYVAKVPFQMTLMINSVSLTAVKIS